MVAPPRGTALLGLLEPGWSRHLSAGGLAGTLEVDAALLGAVATALGDQSRGRSPTEVARRWPACVVVGLAQVARTSYRDGSFWPGWHRAAGLRPTRHSADQWGQAFVEALTTLGGPPPDDRPEQMVLVHAAVPDACLREFLRILAAERRTGGGPVDADLPGADPAVKALLRSGNPAATSFVERCRSTLCLLIDPGRPAEEDRPASGEFLPPRILGAASTVAEELMNSPAPTASLRLDPFGQGVLVADSGGQGWRPALPAEVADPMLIFDMGGEHINGPVLPAEPVWAVHPAGGDLRSDAPPGEIATSRLPLTWRGWRLTQLDLRGVSWLELAIPDEATPRRYPVRGRVTPVLAGGAPVPGVATAAGSPVHAELPAVLLPAGRGRWRIEVRRAVSSRGDLGRSSPSPASTVLTAVTTEAGDWRPGQLWQQLPRPVLGTLTVIVTPADGSPGAGLRRTVAVAEGIGTAYSPLPRLTADRGLEPAEAALIAPPGMTVSPQAALIPAESITAGMTCVAGPAVLGLQVTPPYLRMRIDPEPGSGGKPTAWHHAGPLAIGEPDLRRGGALRLDLPGLAVDPPLEVIAQGQVVQVLQPTREGRYPLRRMLDTVNSHGWVSLRITVYGRAATIAHVSGVADGADPWLPADTTQYGP